MPGTHARVFRVRQPSNRYRKVPTMNTTMKWRSFATYWRQVFHAATRGSVVARTAHPPDLYRSTPQNGPFLR
jgi:hypothetical protein